MTRPTATFALTVAVTAAALAGCGTDTGTTSSTPPSSAPRAQQWTPDTATGARTAPAAPSTLPPEAAGISRDDAGEVGRAAMTVWFTWDTTTDSGPIDGSVRASPLLTPDLARSVAAEVPAQGPGGDWLGWAAQNARLIADVTDSAEPVPPTTSDRAYRSYVIDQAITRPNGVVTGHVQSYVDVVLAHGRDGWEVSRAALR